jgi:hypothetical protein
MAPDLCTAIKSIKLTETQTDKLFLIATDLGPHCPLKTIPLVAKSRMGFKHLMMKDCAAMGKTRLQEVKSDFSNLDQVAQKYKWECECIPAEFQDKGSHWTERSGTGEYVLCDDHGQKGYCCRDYCSTAPTDIQCIRGWTTLDHTGQAQAQL